jgi:homoserine dehydrogenase
MKKIRIGILGYGSVGSALVELIGVEHDAIAARTGLDLEVVAVAVRNITPERLAALGADVLTSDAKAVVADDEIDVVVELIGGVEPARRLILEALGSGKPVISGNKELIANVGAELFVAAQKSNVDLLFEAAVAGGIPLLRVLRESLVGERIKRMMGIVNGTTNYILTQMSENGAQYGDALAEAQQLGYAEEDPTADVEGGDAGAKAAIMATIAFGTEVFAGDVYQEGISQVTADDIASAAHMGHIIKLLAVVEEIDGEVSARVHPAMVPDTHPLASVRNSFNAVFIEGEAVGDLMLYGHGAGGNPTASAVLGDLIAASANLQRGISSGLGKLREARIRPMGECISAFCVHVTVRDRPGVLAEVAGIFGEHGVSIRSMEQAAQADIANIVFITHPSREADVHATLSELRGNSSVVEIGSVIRVIAPEV